MKFPVKLMFVIALFSPYASMAKDINVHVNGMVCGFCAQGITKKFEKRSEVEKINVDLDKKTVSLKIKNNMDIKDDELTSILKDAGYDVEKIERN